MSYFINERLISKKTDFKSAQVARAAEIKKQIADKQNALRSKQNIIDLGSPSSSSKNQNDQLPSKKTSEIKKQIADKQDELRSKPKNIDSGNPSSSSENQNDQLPSRKTSVEKSKIDHSSSIPQTIKEPVLMSPLMDVSDFIPQETNFSIGNEILTADANVVCNNLSCNLRIFNNEQTVNNVTKLLEQQLRIVEEQRIEIQHLNENIKELNEKLQQKGDEFQATLLKDNNSTTLRSPYPPSGFLRASDDHIHLGKGIWLPKVKYNEACNADSPSLFVKMMCDMLFTPEELKESTLTGKPSNRQKKSPRNPKKLDATKVLSIKEITRHWLETCVHYSDKLVDIEVESVKKYIGAKIADLNRPLIPKQKSKKKKSNNHVDHEESSDILKEEIIDLDSDLDNLPSSESDDKEETDNEMEDELDIENPGASKMANFDEKLGYIGDLAKDS
ncbi:uncharacterized protein LOC122499605 [Leptopilina heterotoma]|uniref:uncharacterized protein LOC122499605 n=1 Tax=Leptopilina heterotoma TaxID=63436 RepID=UPI001CA8F9CE|nr:uncharacterized protein LOC122499605 [Leptopilina heterotoma]